MKRNSLKTKSRVLLLSIIATLIQCIVVDAAISNEDQIERLTKQYIESKGQGIIEFNASNIKQFWTENSVFCKNNLIQIDLSDKKESTPFKIKLMNVDESMDCTIEILTEDTNTHFSILNSKFKAISNSAEGEKFLHFNILQSTIHMEETEGLSFYIQFKRNEINNEYATIKSIVLSFSKNNNSSYLCSPGKHSITKDDITLSQAKIEENGNGGISITGKKTEIISSKKIFVTNNTLTTSLKVKNIGKEPTKVHVGYCVFSEDGKRMNHSNFPWQKNSTSICTSTADAGSSRIQINNYPQWVKHCTIALAPQDDYSDVPTFNLLDEKIVEVIQNEDGTAEIILNKPLKEALEKGTKIRVHGYTGSYLYTHIKTLQPGEEQEFSYSIDKNDDYLDYSKKYFSKGVYCVSPIVLSLSADANKDNTIQISNYTISY